MRMRLFLLGPYSDEWVEVPGSFLQADDTPPPIKVGPLFAKRSFNVALIAAHHASHYKTIHYIITLPVWLDYATTVPLVSPPRNLQRVISE